MSLQKVKETQTLADYKNLISTEEWEKLKNSLTPFNYRTKITEWENRKTLIKDVKTRLVFLSENLRRASKRDNPFEISVDLDYLYRVGEQQNWRCALTNSPLEFVRGGNWIDDTNPNSCTIDRINSDLGYIPGNIQLLSWKLNRLKRDYTQEELLSIVVDIYKTKIDSASHTIV